MSLWNRDHEEHLDRLAGYLPTDERPPMTDRMTDAEWAANQARLALDDGRYRLAASFANLADRAAAAAADATLTADLVPIRPASLDDRPATPTFETTEGAMPPFDAPADLSSLPAAALSTAAQAEIFGPVKDATGLPEPTPQRCRHSRNIRGQIQECRAAIYWRHGLVTTGGQPAKQAGWVHVDERIDSDHAAVPGSK